MANTRGTGLLRVWADIDPEHDAEYRRFHDEETAGCCRQTFSKDARIALQP